jgi:pimeloyl-ACP methyl ester carboxylesterase
MRDSELAIHGNGPPLVYVPGMDGTGLLFHRQIPLLQSRYRVATYRLRDAADTMDRLVDDLARIVDEVAPAGERAVIVGESFGGALAMSFALKHAERIDALVILNSFPWFRPRHRLHLAILALRLIPWRTMAVVRRLTAFRLHSRFTGRDGIRRFLELTRGTSRDGYVNRLRILTEYDIRERLGEIRVPTLFLAAERDHLVPAVEQARLMGSRVPGSRVQVLDGHGHICLIAPNLDLARILEDWRGG